MKEHVEGKRRAILQSIAGGAIAGSVGTALSSPVAAETDDNSCVQVDLVEITDDNDIINPVSSSNKYNDEDRLISWLWGNWEEEITGEDMDRLPYEIGETGCTINPISLSGDESRDIEFSWEDDMEPPASLAGVGVEIECENGLDEEVEVALVAYDAPCGPNENDPGWNGSEQFVYSVNRATFEEVTDPRLLSVATPSKPPVTDGLVAHLDAGRINAEDGEDVDTWRDLTDNGNDAEVAGETPTYVLEPSSDEPIRRGQEGPVSPAVRFEQGDWMTLGDGVVDTVDDATLFIVADPETNEDQQIVGSGNSDADGGFGLAYSPEEFEFQYGSESAMEGGLSTESVSPEFVIEPGPRVIYYGKKAEDDEFFAGVESSESEDKYEAEHEPYGDPGEIYLGADSDEDPNLDGDIREVIIYDKGIYEKKREIVDYLLVKHSIGLAS